MTKDIEAIVSGGTKGIGKIIAEYLAMSGYKVLVLYRKDTESANKMLDSYNNRMKNKILGLQCDITNKSDLNKLEDYISDSYPHILVNNAGYNNDAVIWKMETDQWDGVLNTTLKGTFNLSKIIIPKMKQLSTTSSRIINISSVVYQIGVPGTTNYSTAKAGLEGFTKSLAKEIARYKITVNNIALGYCDVGIISTIPDNMLNMIIDSVPLKRLGNKSDIEPIIQFLLKCDYITGQTINVNGGLYG